ncbi:MAG: DUF2851 family protein, partial [Planctomycetota bacterium]
MDISRSFFNEYERIKKSILINQPFRRGATMESRSADFIISDRSKLESGLEINEKLIQYLWGEQLLKGVSLRTLNGESLRIIFPGIWNLTGGPDFRQAQLQIDGKTIVGDIEIHCYASGWQQHRHDYDPQYNQVILHVAFWNDRKEKFIYNTAGQKVHQLILSPWLRKKYEEFDRLLSGDLFYQIGPDKIGVGGMQFGGVGQCYTYFLNPRFMTGIKYFLNLAGQVRLFQKMKKFQDKREVMILPGGNGANKENTSVSPAESYDLLLYQGITEALGYKNNRLAFLELAGRLPYRMLQKIVDFFPSELKPAVVQSVLLRASGLLPAGSEPARTGKSNGPRTYSSE